MIRKFRINNYTKGNLQYRYGSHVSFEKINSHNQIVVVNEENISKATLREIYNLIGINGVYAKLHAHREVTEKDIEGYVTGNMKNVSKETEKAYLYLGVWLPKSQTKKDSDTLYIKSWLFEKNVSFFQM